jgi:hypothetical protein
VRYEKAGFAKLVDASVTMGADLALARRKNKFGCRCRPTRRFNFNLAYDRMVFNGLLFICGTFKKMNTTPIVDLLVGGVGVGVTE